MDRQNPKGKIARPAPEPPQLDPVGLAARVVLGLVLVTSGTFKASSPSEEFSLIIQAYQLVPTELAMGLAVFLPWVELLIGWSLILGYFTRQAALGAAALFACFLGALISTKVRGIPLANCGCFGVRRFHPSPNATIAMDLALCVAVYFAFRRGRTPPSLDNWSDSGYT